MAKATQRDLTGLSKLTAARFKDMGWGVSVTARTGYDISQLIAKITVDRLALANALHREALAALNRQPPSYRNAISRGYYALYQTFRGIVFLTTEGDDHEEHSKLPGHIPPDFPARDYWENALKSARLDRNRADYEPYPRNDAEFEAKAREICGQSKTLRAVARTYLRGKGLNL
jgi:hypothetical protein